MEVLIGQREADAEFAQFRDGAGKGERREALKLVNVDEEGAACREREFRPREGSERERGHEQAAEEVCTVFPEFALPEIDQEDLALVHHSPEADIDFRLDQHSIEPGVSQEGADLVLNGRDGLLAIARVVLREFRKPEGTHLLIRHPGDHLPAIRNIAEQAKNVRERRLAVFQEGIESVSQDMLHPDAPGFHPELLPGFHEAGSRKGDLVLGYPAQRVVAKGLCRIGGIPVDKV